MPMDLSKYDETQASYSPDNRMTRRERVLLGATLRERHGVSGKEALRMVGDIQAKRQTLLNQRVQAAGGRSWESLKGDERTWQEWAQAVDYGPAGLSAPLP